MSLDKENNLHETDLAAVYEKDGFVLPLDILSTPEALELRTDLEMAEHELREDAERLKLLYSYPDRLLPKFDQVIRHPKIIDVVSQVLGPDLMVWGGGLFIKPAKSDKIVSWHQDLTYWGLDDAEEVTCWLALSTANLHSGCMKFIPGSQKERIVPHIDTFADDNLLTRGQEIAVDVNEADAVLVDLKAGQASMHHGHLFHASGPNYSSDRRIGMAIRYIKTSMRQKTGDKSLVAHVSGEDMFKNFKVASSPRGRLHPDDFNKCRIDAELKQKLLF